MDWENVAYTVSFSSLDSMSYLQADTSGHVDTLGVGGLCQDLNYEASVAFRHGVTSIMVILSWLIHWEEIPGILPFLVV